MLVTVGNTISKHIAVGQVGVAKIVRQHEPHGRGRTRLGYLDISEPLRYPRLFIRIVSCRTSDGDCIGNISEPVHRRHKELIFRIVAPLYRVQHPVARFCVIAEGELLGDLLAVGELADSSSRIGHRKSGQFALAADSHYPAVAHQYGLRLG